MFSHSNMPDQTLMWEFVLNIIKKYNLKVSENKDGFYKKQQQILHQT